MVLEKVLFCLFSLVRLFTATNIHASDSTIEYTSSRLASSTQSIHSFIHSCSFINHNNNNNNTRTLISNQLQLQSHISSSPYYMILSTNSTTMAITPLEPPPPCPDYLVLRWSTAVVSCHVMSCHVMSSINTINMNAKHKTHTGSFILCFHHIKTKTFQTLWPFNDYDYKFTEGSKLPGSRA